MSCELRSEHILNIYRRYRGKFQEKEKKKKKDKRHWKCEVGRIDVTTFFLKSGHQETTRRFQHLLFYSLSFFMFV